MSEELKPCPFCGSRAAFDWTLEEINHMIPEYRERNDQGTHVRCLGDNGPCGASMYRARISIGDGKVESFEARYANLTERWNRRAEDPRLRSGAAKIRGFIKEIDEDKTFGKTLPSIARRNAFLDALRSLGVEEHEP